MVLRDLLGPAGGAEEIVEEDNVRGRYIVGLLASSAFSRFPVRTQTRSAPMNADEKTGSEHFYLLGVWVYTNMDCAYTTSEGYLTYGIHCDYHRHRL